MKIPSIVRDGAEQYRRLGTTESAGTIVCTASGDTLRHGVEEFDLGTPVIEIIETIGGAMPGDRHIGVVLSGGLEPGAQTRRSRDGCEL